MSDKKKAFTLIELLVVIAIIGILATISVLALQNARAKSRDAKRVADIKQMQTALELYFNDINHYPTAEEFAEGSIHSTSSLGTTTYMTHIPSAPMPADGGCSPTDNAYVYTQEDGGGNYSLDFCLGGQVASLSPGSKCSTSNAIYDGNCCTSISVYYAGKNYNAAKVGNQCWLAENLNVGTMIWDPSTCIVGGSSCAADPDNSFDYNNIEKYCYQNTESNCSTFGALYSWTEAFALPHSCKDVGDYVCATLSGCQSVSTPTCNFSLMRRGICPSGWHLPSWAEFTDAINAMIANPSLATYFTGVAPGDLYSTNFYENLDIRVYYFFLYPGLTWADKNQSNLNWTGYDMIGNPHAGWTVRCLKD